MDRHIRGRYPPEQHAARTLATFTQVAQQVDVKIIRDGREETLPVLSGELAQE